MFYISDLACQISEKFKQEKPYHPMAYVLVYLGENYRSRNKSLIMEVMSQMCLTQTSICTDTKHIFRERESKERLVS